jgi:hypothetical protein
MQCKYQLFAHPHDYVFTLRLENEARKEFPSVGDAVAYAGRLPGSDDATVAVFNSSGTQLAELRVRDEVLLTS